LRLTRIELCALLTRITNELPDFPEGSAEREASQINLRRSFGEPAPHCSTDIAIDCSGARYFLKDSLICRLYLATNYLCSGAAVMSLNQAKFGDGVFVERRHDVRIIVNIAGRYSLADRRDARGERRIFACRAINVSPNTIALAAPVNGKVGERVIAHIDHLGKLEGPIGRLLDRGFVMGIVASEEERDMLAAKITWLGNYKNHDAPDQRADERKVPSNPYSKMVLPDGSVETCLILDLSVSGAAISADTVPNIGTVLAVGRIVGRVARHFLGGFAVQFIERQSLDTIEAMVIRE
jgi:hypothetical protein